MSSQQGDAVAPSDEASTVKQNSPAAGTGAAGTNYMRDAGYDTGTSTQGYMATQKPFSTGEGYMTAPAGDGSGYGDQNPGSGHNTGIGATGAGTGDTGYRHGAGHTHAAVEVGSVASSRQDAHTLKNLLHLHRHKDNS